MIEALPQLVIISYQEQKGNYNDKKKHPVYEMIISYQEQKGNHNFSVFSKKCFLLYHTKGKDETTTPI